MSTENVVTKRPLRLLNALRKGDPASKKEREPQKPLATSFDEGKAQEEKVAKEKEKATKHAEAYLKRKRDAEGKFA